METVWYRQLIRASVSFEKGFKTHTLRVDHDSSDGASSVNKIYFANIPIRLDVVA